MLQPFPAGGKTSLQTTAEQDMEIIRTKRATSSSGGGTTTGQPKSKYRKRSVSLFLTMTPFDADPVFVFPDLVRAEGHTPRKMPFV